MKSLNIFVMGLLAAFAVMTLMGSSSVDDQIGRYQISAWAADKGGSLRHGYYV